MIQVSLADKLHLKIEASREVLYTMKEYFTEFKPGYVFAPKYKSGEWDGKICLFSIYDKLLPYGLMTEFLLFKKKEFPHEEMVIGDDVKRLFAQDPYYDDIALENLEPWDYRPYQEDCIRKALKYKRCIIRAATSAGKSYIITGIIKNLVSSNKIKNSIIIVPTCSLVEQFYKDIIDYGFDKNDVGRVYSKFKEWDKSIVISTWQTLKNVVEKIKDFDCIIVDEVHGVRGQKLRDTIKESNAEYRIGCTGTMPDCRLEALQVKSYLGPIVAEIPASELADLGYISNLKIIRYNLEYRDKIFNKDYEKAKKEIFKDPFRLNFIKEILNKTNSTTLLLVGKVETEGELLKDYLLKHTDFTEENMVFISGKVDSEDREEWRQRIIKNPDTKYVVIATYGTFSTGINIPNLGHLIFVSPFKAKIRILQSIGRVLRKHVGKLGAIVYDIVDLNNRWFEKYGDIRLRFYDREKFEVIEVNVREPNNEF